MLECSMRTRNFSRFEAGSTIKDILSCLVFILFISIDADSGSSTSSTSPMIPLIMLTYSALTPSVSKPCLMFHIMIHATRAMPSPITMACFT